MPTTIAEIVRPGEYLVSEAGGSRSREVAVIAGGVAAAYKPGTVMGKVTATGAMTILAPAAADGSQTAAAVYYGFGKPLANGDLSVTVTARDAEVNGLLLTWPAGITANQQTAAIAQLAAQGIIVRT
jgi:hypothetical protein